MSTPHENKFQHEDTLAKRTRYNELILRVWPYLKRYKLLLGFVLCIVILHTAIGRVLPSIIGYAVDHVLVGKDISLLWKICFVYLALELIRFLMVIVETYFFQVLGQRVIYDLRSAVFAHVQHLPVSFFDKTPVGRLVTRLTNDFNALADLFTAGLVSVFTDSLSLFAIVIAMSLISVKLTLVVMAISPLMFWACIKITQAARDTLRIIKRQSAAMNAYVSENISGMKVIQLYVREKRQVKKFEHIGHEYTKTQVLNIHYLALLTPVLNGFNAITVAVALYYGGLLKDVSAIKVGALVAFLTHVQDFLPPLRNILEKYQTFQASLASAERIFDLLDVSREEFDGAALPPTRVTGQIEFDRVSFAYSRENGPVLRNVSFKILPGQSVAIVGATGSGKSTIVSLLQRFYELDNFDAGSGKDSGSGPEVNGQILLDGQNIKSLDKRDLRSRIGVVQQDFFLFRGTVASNISLNDSKIPPEKIRQAAVNAHCEELITNHLGGLNAEVQERGSNLSTGEKQLINFARVLAFNPDLLILDEATAYIDSHSEALIQQVTREITRGRTSIIIAHRLSTILDCDKILVLDNGQLVEEGTHTELLSRNGIYQNLYSLQLSKQTQH